MDEKAAQKARADEARRRVAELESPVAPPSEECPESPREFVHRRMHELKEQRRNEDSES